MKRRGLSLIELLIAIVLLALVLAVFFPSMLSAWRMQSLGVGTPDVENDARGMALKVADSLRAATLCNSSDTGCTVDAAAENASATGLTAYRRNDDGTLRKLSYAVVGGVFQQQIDGGNAIAVNSDATLALVYYSASAYNPSTLTVFVPTNATLKNLVAVGIRTGVTRGGLTSTYTTLVRLRNSPKP